MPQRTKVTPAESGNYLMTNIWLLDDKFMTYSAAYSDLEIKKIIEDTFKNDKTDLPIGDKKRPDMVVLYNKDINHDAIVVEFKGANASFDEKRKASSEIKYNCYSLRQKTSEINTIWSYIITSIDTEYESSLLSDDYIPLFTNAKNGKMFYYFAKNANAHIYVLDINAITEDAFARNKTFLNILKNH